MDIENMSDDELDKYLSGGFTVDYTEDELDEPIMNFYANNELPNLQASLRAFRKFQQKNNFLRADGITFDNYRKKLVNVDYRLHPDGDRNYVNVVDDNGNYVGKVPLYGRPFVLDYLFEDKQILRTGYPTSYFASADFINNELYDVLPSDVIRDLSLYHNTEKWIPHFTDKTLQCMFPCRIGKDNVITVDYNLVPFEFSEEGHYTDKSFYGNYLAEILQMQWLRLQVLYLKGLITEEEVFDVYIHFILFEELFELQQRVPTEQYVVDFLIPADKQLNEKNPAVVRNLDISFYTRQRRFPDFTRNDKVYTFTFQVWNSSDFLHDSASLTFDYPDSLPTVDEVKAYAEYNKRSADSATWWSNEENREITLQRELNLATWYENWFLPRVKQS